MRLHLTISKTQELLHYWFGISLSKGSISKALLEAGRAASCLEPEIIAALRVSGLLHVDETSWKEHKIQRWLWVAVGHQAVYFCVGPRNLEMAQKIIGDFKGILMTDGYKAYRWYKECLKQRDAKNEKVRAFAGEVINDNQAIFRILKQPDCPLTNNSAEQALRPMVILRKISYGSKTEEGSRSIAILASATETIRVRGHIVWSFFSRLFKARRSGCSPPSLPPIFVPS